jgi:hypothetical protein
MPEVAMIEIDGVSYQKSSKSNSGGQFCVGVAQENGEIWVINTNRRGPIVRFTKEEWRAFMAGVKLNEFDIG